MILRKLFFTLCLSVSFVGNSQAETHCEHDYSVECMHYRAEQGDESSQYWLGFMYATGKGGVLQDYQEAVRWYRMGAEQGDEDSHFILDILTYGPGDDREAVSWFRMAAEQGNVSAQYRLGAMYWHGEGVVENEYESYIWYSIAKAGGNKDSAKNLRENKWHLYLTASEIKSAKREAARRLEKIDNRYARSDNSAPVYANEAPVAIAPQNKGIAETVYENTWRSVVVIKTSEAQGSGIIVRPNIVATNCHVIDDGGDIVVFKHDNRLASTDTLFSATVRRRDDENDFCLLDVAGLWGIQASMRKYDTLNIGENVYALGSPKGLDLSLSTGIISQLREGTNSRYIQTDAAFSPGSSGGGLFDSQGNLIGILTSKFTTEGAEGLGFAIPADLALVL